MKLLFITPIYEPAWEAGGVVNSISTLCRALTEQGLSVSVYTTNASFTEKTSYAQLNHPVNLGNVEVFYFKSTFGQKNLFYSNELIKKLLDTARDFDAVYIAAWFMWTGIKAASICYKMNIPMIAGIHGGFSVNTRRKSYIKKNLFKRLFIDRSLNRAAAVRLTCNKEKTDAGNWLNDHPLIIIPNAVDPEKYYPCHNGGTTFRARHGIPSDAPVLISAGRPDWMKRVDLLIGAIAKTDQWRLVIVGDHTTGKGPEWKRYAKALNVEDRVLWCGFLNGEELLNALSAADIFSLISESENFGRVVAEAMMCGLPVVISRDVGLYEYIKNEEFTYIADKSSGSIARTLTNFKYTTFGKAPDKEYIRQTAIKLFSPETTARIFISEIHNILSSNRRTT